MLKSIVVDGATLTMTYDEALKVTSPVTSGGIQAYNVGTAGSNFTVLSARSGVGADNTQVTMTLDPPAEAGQTIGISYHGADATTASKVQDLAGNAAAAFLANASPVPVQNITPGVESVAFAGAAQTYAIDDKVAVDIVFTQAVAVATSSARPELSLTVGVEHPPGALCLGYGQRHAPLRIHDRRGRRGQRRNSDPGRRALDADREFHRHRRR